ncbi:MAG: hypothetical protein QXL16_02390 [Candidatus Micrarchaeaceae archaeon]
MLKDKRNFVFIFIYLIPIISPLIALLVADEIGMKRDIIFHSIQAIIISTIILIFLSFPLLWVISILIWVFGIYVGYKSAIGEDLEIPVISKFSRSIEEIL